VGRKIYVVGGFRGHHAAAVGLNGKLYVIGGIRRGLDAD
jgi:Kelch motif